MMFYQTGLCGERMAFDLYYLFDGQDGKYLGSDCLEFKPERWLKEGEFVVENPYKFPVFHAGPRLCLGKEMAFIQMKSIVASVIHTLHFQIEDGITCPDYVLSLTMRMRGGLPVLVRCRRHKH